jgi:hypothetical protein
MVSHLMEDKSLKLQEGLLTSSLGSAGGDERMKELKQEIQKGMYKEVYNELENNHGVLTKER